MKSVRLGDALEAKLREAAKLEGISESALIRQAIDRRCDAILSNRADLRMHTLMQRYRDTPMDLPDASLIVIAELRRLTRIFTIDSHFHAYRLHGRQRLEVIP